MQFRFWRSMGRFAGVATNGRETVGVIHLESEVVTLPAWAGG